jgi:MFS family permease
MDRSLLVLSTGAAIRTLGAALYSPFLALFLLNALHLGYVEVGAVVAGVGAVQIPVSYGAGLLADRIGRRPLIVGGLVGEAAATAGLAYACAVLSFPGAVLFALAGGISATMTVPAVFAFIADLAEGPARTRGFTSYRVGANVGYAAGTGLGGGLITVLGFSGAVGVAAAIIAAGALFLVAVLPGRTASGPPPPGPLPPGAPSTRAPTRSLAESFRILRRDRAALELLLAVLLAALVVGQWQTTFPLFVHNGLGIPYGLLGLGLALNGVIVVFGQNATTEAVLGRRLTTIMVAGMGLYVLGFLGLGAAGALGFAPVAVFFVVVGVLTIGENLTSIPQTTLPSNIAPQQEVGSYNGAFNAIGGIGILLAVLFGSTVLAYVREPPLLWTILMLPAVPAALLYFDAARRVPGTADRA